MKECHVKIGKYAWNLSVYFAVTCYHTDDIVSSLLRIDCPEAIVRRVAANLEKREMDTGFTYSNKPRRETVMVVGLHSSAPEFLNSFEHELRHLVDDMADALFLEPKEEVAYLTGELNAILWKDIHQFVCCKCKGHGRR